MGNDNEESLRLRREEVRGVFVIGLLALLLALKLDSSFGKMFETLRPLNLAIVYWGLYVISVAIGISSDIIDERMAKAMWEVAGQFFFVGVVITAALGWTYVVAIGFGRSLFWGSDFRLFGITMLGGLVVKQSQNLIISLIRKREISRTEKVWWAKRIIVDLVGLVPMCLIPM